MRGANRGFVAVALALGMTMAAPATVQGQETPEFHMLSPRDGDFLVGATLFRFEPVGELDRIDVFVGGKLIGAARAPAWNVTWDAPPGLAATSVRAIGYRQNTVAGRAGIRIREAPFSETIEVTVVQLHPVVTDRRGRYVDNLTQSDFEILENGKPVAVESFSSERGPLHVAVLMDTSLSMRDKLIIVQDAAAQFIDQLEPEDTVSVYGFNHAVQLQLRRSGHRALAKEKIRALQPDGGTAIYDATIRVLDDLASARPSDAGGRQAIVAFSDGVDEHSLAPLERAAEKARQSDVVLYAITTSDEIEHPLARQDLTDLAEATGGQLFVAEKLRDLQGLFDRVIHDLAAQYRLSFTPPAGAKGERRVEVRVQDRKLKVRCRTSYFVPG